MENIVSADNRVGPVQTSTELRSAATNSIAAAFAAILLMVSSRILGPRKVPHRCTDAPALAE